MAGVGDDRDEGTVGGTASTVEHAKADTLDALLADVARAPSVTPVLAGGTIVDATFRIEKKLGAGGMGVVYLARDLRLNRDVALKLHTASGAATDERALREAKVMARLTHPNVITVYEVGTYDGRLFIAMEYVDGGTLRGWLTAHPRRWSDVLDAFVKAGRGLAAAHDAGLVHRDFKPDNVLIGNDGRVRVADFGLARAANVPAGGAGAAPQAEADATREPEDGVSISSPLTAAGARAGTPAYMSPEQRRGEEVDARSDQYGFCVALREALDHVGGGPRWVRRAVARGVEDDPARRWSSVHALIDRLEQGRRRRRVGAIGAAVLAVTATASIVGWQLRSAPERRCAGSQERLRGVWDGPRAVKVRAAIAPAASGAIDRYVGEWATMHHDACAATWIRGDQSERVLDARMSCLERGRAQLDQIVAIMAEDPGAAQRAEDAIRTLPRVALCANPSLSAIEPLPSDPEKTLEIGALRLELARVRALYATGKYDEGADASQRAAEWARRVGYAPLVAEAAYYLGSYRNEAETPAETEAAFREALEAGIAGGADDLAIEAAADLAHHLAVRNRLEESEWMFALGRSLLTRRGGDESLEGHLVGNYVELLRRRGKFDALLTTAERTLEIRRRIDGPTSWRVGQAQLQVALAHMELGRWSEAKQTLSEAHENLRASLGPEHPLALEALGRLGGVLTKVGEYGESEATLRRLLEIQTRRYGAEDPRLASTLDKLSIALNAAGKHEEALPTMERSIALQARRPDADLEYLGMQLGNLTIAYYGAGKLDMALDAARRSYEAFDRVYDAGSPHRVRPMQFLGTLQRYNEKLEDSLRTLTGAAALARKALPPEHPERANVEIELGMTLLALGRGADALEQIEPAAAVVMRPGGNPSNAAEARFTLARALWDSGRDRKRARTLAEEARREYAGLGQGFAANVAEIDAWLASRK